MAFRLPLFVLLASVLAAPLALAHGGRYVAPPDAGSAGGQDGGTVAPPTNPGGALAGAPGSSAAGTRGGSGRSGAGSRRSRRGDSARRGGGVTTAGDIELSLASWTFWWEANKDRLLALRDRRDRGVTTSGSVSALTGKGRRHGLVSSRRPAAALVDALLVPFLRRTLATSTEADELDSALVALGRIVPPGSRSVVHEAALPLLAHPELSVASAATLSLGIAQAGGAVPPLRALLRDDTSARRLTGGGGVHWLVRAFAALSLGRLGDDGVLRDVVARLADSERDVKVCSIAALGLLEPDHPRLPEVRSVLLELLGDRRLDPALKSYVPTALGRLGPDAVAARRLLDAVRHPDTDDRVRQSCAIGLGRVARLDDEVLDTLENLVTDERDALTRRFALIALARLGSRDEAAGEPGERRERLMGIVQREIAGQGRTADQRSWGALAAALYSRGHPEVAARMADRLVAAYDAESDPEHKGAFAIALGLLEVRSAGDRLLADFVDHHDDALRGHLAEALGLVGHLPAADRLRSALRRDGVPISLATSLATGLGLLRDPSLVPDLVTALQRARTHGVRASICTALGRLGDRDAVEPLLALAESDEAPTTTRAFAIVALGMLAERDALAWNTALREANNYAVPVPAIAEALDIL